LPFQGKNEGSIPSGVTMVRNKILSVKGLYVDLDKEKILQNIDFELNEKEILVILGPNGAGKTVLLKTLLGLLPFKGYISWQPQVHLGYVPEDFDVSETLPLSVEEFFNFKKTHKTAIISALSRVGIRAEKSFLDKRIGTLSSGQLRRALIAWAMVDNPNVILLDEPMLGIDIHGRETIYDSLVKLWQNKNQSIILISHEIGEVCKKADKVLALNKKVLFYGEPKEVITPQNLAKIYGSTVSL
jgi:zinc transport system ATP-binding protein